jgi:hypothetical protein
LFVLAAMGVTAQERRSGSGFARVLCALVALAAGLVGMIMVVAPASTGSFFSWPLGPSPLAALVGGFYLASAVAFGWAAAREPQAGLRGLCLAVFGLSVPTLVATAAHRDVFDFGRWQARAWVVLFVASPTLFGLALLRMRQPIADRRSGEHLPVWSRAVLVALSLAYGAMAVVLWFWPEAVSRHAPFGLAGLGARFIGSWAAFLAILAAFAALRPWWEQARIPVAALVLWPLGGLGATLPRLGDLRADESRIVYVVGMLVLSGLAAVALFPERVPARDRAWGVATQATTSIQTSPTPT